MARVAVVTGGTRGIGAAISKALKAAGYKVAANYPGNDEAAAKFKAETGIAVYKWDVSNYDACVAGLAKVAKELGPVDMLVNNAGITRDGMFHKMTPEQWYEVINTNLNSLFNMSRPVIDGMRERSFGRIINISSINGQKGQMGQANYSAAKAGEIGFTKALAQENANKGITVNAICPGYIATEMVMAVSRRTCSKSDRAADPGRPSRRAGRDRALRRLPRLRRRRLHHRLPRPIWVQRLKICWPAQGARERQAKLMDTLQAETETSSETEKAILAESGLASRRPRTPDSSTDPGPDRPPSRFCARTRSHGRNGKLYGLPGSRGRGHQGRPE